MESALAYRLRTSTGSDMFAIAAEALALVAELRAGLPPGLAVAGSYLDGIGVPACIGAAGRAIETLAAEVAR